MANVLNDPLADTREKEFSNLQSRGKGGPLRVFYLIAVALLCAVVTIVIVSQSRSALSIEKAREQLLAVDLSWARNLSKQQSDYQQWLERHGTRLEKAVFDQSSELVFHSSLFFVDLGRSHSLSFLNVILAIHFGVLRVFFVIVACWRVWFVVALLAAVRQFFKLRVHQGSDFLGQLGNGRMFFSGIRCGLDGSADADAPCKQVTSLACPPVVPAHVAKHSALAAVLDAHQASNKTNLALLAIILRHAHFPFFVAGAEDQAAFSKHFAGANLAKGTELTLDALLSLHGVLQEVAAGERNEADLSALQSASTELHGPLSAETYATLLQAAALRVLTPTMRKEFQSWTAPAFATAALALHAGKVLAYAFESGRWMRKSSFPQLCSRSILHSIPEYTSDYSFQVRNSIRRAVIYSSRQSVLAPVQFPVDLSWQTHACRQVLEVASALPHELQISADQVELFGMVCELHRDWVKKFVDAVMTQHDLNEDSYATQAGLLFMPVGKLVKMFDGLLHKRSYRRLDELVNIVGQKQRLEQMSREVAPDNVERAPVSAQRVFPPLSSPELKLLQSTHSVRPEVLRRWSSYRVILNSFGWLGRRVGDYTVSDSSVIFTVFKGTSSGEANELGLVGKAGMVALRGSRLEERLGKYWQSRFNHAASAVMAENPEDYAKLLRGEEMSLPPLDEKMSDPESSPGSLNNMGG